jgi:hypothetical protein
MRFLNPVLWLLAVAGVLVTNGASATEEASWRVSGDLRFGYFNGKRQPRVGVASRDEEGRMRLRVALEGALGDGWSVRGRLAGRYGTEDAPNSFYLRFQAPGRSGAALGDTTIDVLNLSRRAVDDSWSIQLGRLQTGPTLRGVAGKALDRNDSTNVGINWTDGLYAERRLAAGWRGHFLLQYQDRAGIGQATAAPLDFSRGGSRIGSYAAIDGEADGIWVQRRLAVTWKPDALAPQGLADSARKDYLALDAKLAAAWPIGSSGTRLLLAAEIGYAPNRPDRSVLATGGSGKASGLAWQTTVNFMDLAPGHHLGFVYARIGAGWLLTSDFRGNDELSEVRYQWRITPKWSMEARYRLREEIKIPAAAARAREDTDVYIRLTARF